MTITTLGIDLAKNVFQLHGVDKNGKVCLRKRLRRAQLASFIENLPVCKIGMEACGGSNFWYREFSKMGHDVKLIAAQFVKPFVKSNKNDMNDAEAICEAMQRPNMRFVSPKSVRQQDIQSIHRVRQRLVRRRTSLTNEVRGLLLEYGIVIAKNIKNVRVKLVELVEDAENGLTDLSRSVFSELYSELQVIDEQISTFNKKIKDIFNQSEDCQRISKIEGVGPITATAVIAACGNPKVFKNGREFSAWLGLVPKQSSSGNKINLLGISKRGDGYIRYLLVHGARSVVRHAKNKTDSRSSWVNQLEQRKGHNKTCVAVANKNARIIWAILNNKTAYKAA